MISVLSHCDVEKEQKMAIRIQRNSKKENENENEGYRETMRKRLERWNVKQKIKDKKEERGGRNVNCKRQIKEK